jgi:hypothetical protein
MGYLGDSTKYPSLRYCFCLKLDLSQRFVFFSFISAYLVLRFQFFSNRTPKYSALYKLTTIFFPLFIIKLCVFKISQKKHKKAKKLEFLKIHFLTEILHRFFRVFTLFLFFEFVTLKKSCKNPVKKCIFKKTLNLVFFMHNS